MGEAGIESATGDLAMRREAELAALFRLTDRLYRARGVSVRGYNRRHRARGARRSGPVPGQVRRQEPRDRLGRPPRRSPRRGVSSLQLAQGAVREGP